MLQIYLSAELSRFEFAMSGGFGCICSYFQGRRHVPELSLPLNSSHVVRLCAELDRVWSLISVASLQARFMLLHSVLWFAAFNSRRLRSPPSSRPSQVFLKVGQLDASALSGRLCSALGGVFVYSCHDSQCVVLQKVRQGMKVRTAV